MEKLGAVITVIAVIFLTAFLLAWPTMWLWNNALMGAVDGIHPIGFWQALGITFLCNILFKNSNTNKDK